MGNQIPSSVSFKKILRGYFIVICCLAGIPLFSMLLISLFGSIHTYHAATAFFENFLQKEFLIYLLVGFLVQMIDGALGMAYGVSSTSFLTGIFTLFIGINSWQIVAGLMVGGAIAAPFGAYICHKINMRIAMTLVGLVIIFLSIRTLLISLNLL